MADSNNLRSILDCFTPGPIPSATEVERALADCWHEFVGNDDHGMEAYKLIGRMEKVEWRPPILSFTIERHGGTVLGSTRAELHRWQINLDEITAACSVAGQRTVGPTSKAVRQSVLQLVAQEIAALVQQGASDPRLNWKGSDAVHVVVEQIIPTTSGFARTVQGRRKRLRQALEEVLAKDGWTHAGRNVFKRTNVMEQ
jgi:hypothetical protein